MDITEKLMKMYDAMRARFGHRKWWPGDTPLEVMLGAILTQRTNWKNVEKAIESLREADAIDAHVLVGLDEERLQDLVRPAGYYRQKTARLQRLAAWLVENADGDTGNLADWSTSALREELLCIRGIGPETADSMLLYALQRPVFVVDTYTMRVTCRHELIYSDCGYEELQGLFTTHLPQDIDLYQDYHAQLVEVGKRYCRPTPKCAECPLLSVLGEPTPDPWL